MSEKLCFKNKKGDIPSIIFVIITIFIIGILFLFSNHVNEQIYGKFEDYLQKDYNNTEVDEAVTKIHGLEEGRMWDYAFLALAMGYFLSLGLVAFSTRITPIFFWLYAIIAIIGLILATIVSNIWQEAAANPEFATTITRFPITDALLGSYFPIFISGVIVVVMILLFGKFPGDNQ